MQQELQQNKVLQFFPGLQQLGGAMEKAEAELRRLEGILGGHQVPPPMGKGSLHGITQLPAQACPENPQGWELTMSLRRLCQWLLSLQNIPWWASSQSPSSS